MKVAPSNQTLILASERRGTVAPLDSTLDRAVNAASLGGVLKRVTIVARQPDTHLLYLQADYATASDAGSEAAGEQGAEPETAAAHDAAPAHARAVARLPASGALTALTAAGGALIRTPATGSRDAYGNEKSKGQDVAPSYTLSPADQYARTQRLSVVPHITQIDVHA